jgi:hypothetical protein
MSSAGTGQEYESDILPALDERLYGDVSEIRAFAEQLAHVEGRLPTRIAADPETVEQGLAKLVLTLIELIRQLLEKQAMRRVESGSLTDEQIERMGETFLKLDQKMIELKEQFGLQDEELNIHLGPLGDLL